MATTETGISAFKSNFTGGGARPNLFVCRVDFPVNIKNAFSKAPFLVKGAALPSSVIAPIEVPFRGRKLKVAGDRTFEAWTITVINDTDFSIRNSFEKWMDLVNAHESNTSAYSTGGNPLGYYRNLNVTQLDRDGGALKSYDFIDAFPTNIGQIDLNYETNDQVEEFTVELQYQYWTSDFKDRVTS